MKKKVLSIIICSLIFINFSAIPIFRYIYRNIKCNQLISKEVIYQIDLNEVANNFQRLTKIGYEEMKILENPVLILKQEKSHSGAEIIISFDLQPASPTGSKVPNSNTRYEFSNYYDVDYLWDFKWEHDSPSFMIYNENACIDMDYGDPNRDWEQDLLDIMEAVKEE